MCFSGVCLRERETMEGGREGQLMCSHVPIYMYVLCIISYDCTIGGTGIFL